MKSSQIYGLLGSFLSGIIIVLLLMFVFMPFEKEEEEEGIMVSFGDGIEGLGETVAETATASPTPTKEELMTQEDEETVAEAQKKKEREEKRQQEIEKKRQEELERQRIEDEQTAKTDKARDKANVFNKLVEGGHSSGGGTDENPAGKGSSNGNDWSLFGRDLRGGIPRPEYNVNVEGRIVVSIRVDENGNVISATTNGKDTNGKATNITDRTLLEMTLAAAKKVKFSPGKNNVYGTITYNFKLN